MDLAKQMLKPRDENERKALKSEVQKSLERLRASYLIRRPFLALVSMRLDLVSVIDDRLNTAATNGRIVYFDARFFKSLDQDDREFVFAHEVWHCALGHFSRVGNRKRAIWNLAADHEINFLLEKDGFKVPESAIIYRKYSDKNAEQVYEILKDKIQEIPQSFDLHLPLAREIHPSMLIDPDFKMSENPPSLLTAEAMLLAAARDAKKRFGTLPGHIAAKIENITKPQINWRSVLAQFLQQLTISNYNWSRPQRRYIHAGHYLPSRHVRKQSKLVIAIDVSGSVFTMLESFVSEVFSLAGYAGKGDIDVYFFDTEIKYVCTVHSMTDIFQLSKQVRGGGGTSFKPVFEAINQSGKIYDGLIVLTDGIGQAPRSMPKIPVVWALTKTGRAPVEWGIKIEIPDNNLSEI